MTQIHYPMRRAEGVKIIQFNYLISRAEDFKIAQIEAKPKELKASRRS